MKFRDLLYVTLQNFKNRKSRVFFTVLGVAVAIAVVLSLVSFGYGLQKSILEKITTEESLLSLDIVPSDAEVIKFDASMVKKIEAIPLVERVSPEATFTGQAAYGGVVSEADINVVNPDFFGLDGKTPLVGKFFTNADSKEIVVSSLVAQLYNLTNEQVIGKRMTFTVFVHPDASQGVALSNTPTTLTGEGVKEVSFGDDFEIIGVVEGGTNTGEVFINKKDFPNIPIEKYQFAKVKVRDTNALADVRVELINKGFAVSALSDTVSQANKIFGAIQITLGIFGVFALIVAGIGLVNTMTISLLERTNEIGIMRAIGAAPKDIRKIFLVESIVIGFLGGLLGIILGVVASELLNWGFNLLAKSFGGEATRLFAYPVWFVLFIVGLSTAVGFLGGIWPARRAGLMNPLEALRYK